MTTLLLPMMLVMMRRRRKGEMEEEEGAAWRSVGCIAVCRDGEGRTFAEAILARAVKNPAKGDQVGEAR